MITDPVCGKRINRGKANIVIEHEGVAYSLCCPLCQAEFERAPRRTPGRRLVKEPEGNRSAIPVAGSSSALGNRLMVVGFSPRSLTLDLRAARNVQTGFNAWAAEDSAPRHAR